MSAPAQKCDLSREEAEEKLGAKYTDFCPLCKDLGANVKVGFHKSRGAASSSAGAVAAGPLREHRECSMG